MSPFQRAVTNEGSGTPLQGVVAKYPFQRVHYAEATDLTGATHNLRGHVILILLVLLLVTYYIRVLSPRTTTTRPRVFLYLDSLKGPGRVGSLYVCICLYCQYVKTSNAQE